MTNVWCARAEFGTYTKHFVERGYAAIGWMPDIDLSAVKSRDVHNSLLPNLVSGELRVRNAKRFAGRLT